MLSDNKEFRFLIPVSPPFIPSMAPRSSPITSIANVSLFKHEILEKLFQIKIQQDGTDATDQLLKIFSYPLPKIHVILLKGVTFAGLNFFNPFKLHEVTGAVILIFSKHQKTLSLQALTLQHRLENLHSILSSLPPPLPVTVHNSNIKIQVVGADLNVATRILRQLKWDGNLPIIMKIAQRISRPIRLY